ncbi:MAG: polyphenol oxidase family protein [Candidatus Marinimicrobia bacterium]|nr:polyphenol oxidase family protein [Candidatus Neomarinimicrobiota bacterium]
MGDRYFDTYRQFKRLTGTTALTSTRAFYDDGIPVRDLTNVVFQKLDLKMEDAVWPVQIHSGTVHFIRKPGPVDDCDGVISDCDSLILLLQTADCVPVFMADKKGQFRGLIHAGWRGLRQQIIIRSAKLMKEMGIRGADLIIATGPSICRDCYTVGEDVAEYFPNHIRSLDNRMTLDLQGIVRDQLLQSGIPDENILQTNRCTVCHRERYVSYRVNKTHNRLLSILRK